MTRSHVLAAVGVGVVLGLAGVVSSAVVPWLAVAVILSTLFSALGDLLTYGDVLNKNQETTR